MSDRREERPNQANQTAASNIRAKTVTFGNIIQQIYNFASLSKDEQDELKIRDGLLKKVKEQIQGRVEKSLRQDKRIVLYKEMRPRLVNSKSAKKVKRALPERDPLPLETKMIGIFEKAARRLLILGFPGVGKTFTLLELAEELLARAEQKIDNPNQPKEPIPVLLDIPTWKRSQTIEQWIISEIKGFSKEIIKGWLERRELILLMDELDLLNADDQRVFIEQINIWLEKDDSPPGLVVCSRLQEYEVLKVKFKFEGAVCLESLREEQISEALNKSRYHQDLWKNLQKDSNLLNIARMPLFLSILSSLAGQDMQGMSVEQLKQRKTQEARRHYLLEAYTKEMLERDIENYFYAEDKQPSIDKTEYWLTQLAKVLKEKSLTELLIEDIQPDWWLSETEKRTYELAVRLIVGLIAGLTAGLYLGGWVHEPLLLLFAILSGAITGAISHILSPRLDGLPQFNSRLLLPATLYVQLKSHLLLSGTLYGLIFTIVTYGLGSATSIPLQNWRFLFLLTGIGVGTVFCALSPQAIKPADKVEFSLSRTVNVVCYALLFGLISVFLRSIILQPGFYDKNFKYIPYELISFILVGMLAVSIPRREVSFDEKDHPNQGIWRTRDYAVMWFMIGAFTSAIFTIRADGFEIVRSTGIALTVGLLASLIGSNNSGIACIQHVILRLTLSRKGCIPWNYARFLNYAEERTFLQQVGGGYRFWHNLLREYFADMD